MWFINNSGALQLKWQENYHSKGSCFQKDHTWMKTLIYRFNFLCNNTDLSIQEHLWYEYDDIDAPFGGQKQQNMSRSQESSTPLLYYKSRYYNRNQLAAYLTRCHQLYYANSEQKRILLFILFWINLHLMGTAPRPLFHSLNKDWYKENANLITETKRGTR